MFFSATEEPLVLMGQEITKVYVNKANGNKKTHAKKESDFHGIENMCGIKVNVGVAGSNESIKEPKLNPLN